MDLTIVTPSFRQLEWLELCIASVADQVGVGVEHIIQDAGTEGFEEFSKKMAKKWPNRPGYRRIMVSEPDQGMYDAVNRGLRRGMAPLCAYLNCDEQYLPGALEKVVAYFRRYPDTEVLFAGVLIVDAHGNLISARKPVRLSLPHVATCHLPNFTCAMFFRRRMVDVEGAWFSSCWRDCADALWVMERLKRGTLLGRIMDFTTAFTDTGANMNLSPNAIREARKIRESAPAVWRWLKPLWVAMHWLGKLLDGAYWPQPLRYALHIADSEKARTTFFANSPSPFWIRRWFIRERIRWAGKKPQPNS